MKRNNQISAGTLVGGRFQIQSFLGEEGGSELYQAQDSQGGAAVALRVFSATEMTRTVVETDLGKAAQVSHKNLATLVAWGLEGDRIYVATEATDGPSLRQILDAKRREGSVIGLTHAHVLLGHVGNALDRVHSTLVHGGVNPSAIRVTSAGRVKLTDLGLSRALPALARRGGADFNSQGVYLAPEVAAGEELSPSADVYSLAAILYEMLTGHAPASPLWPPSQVNSAVPPAVDAVVARGMAPLSETRFSRPKELLDALGAVLASMAGGVQPAAVQPKAPSARLSMGKSFSVADAVRLTEEYERWLIQKDKLDYGPFSLAQVMAQMEKGIFNGDDIIVDVDSGDRQKIRENPQLVEFTRLTERRLEAQRRAQAEQAHEHVERKKGRWTIFIIGSAVVALAAGLAWFIHQRVAAKDDVLASRVSEADVDAFLKDVKILVSGTPAGGRRQARWARRRRGRSRRGLQQQHGPGRCDPGGWRRHSRRGHDRPSHARQLPPAGSLHHGQGRADHRGRLRGSAHRTGQGGAGQRPGQGTASHVHLESDAVLRLSCLQGQEHHRELVDVDPLIAVAKRRAATWRSLRGVPCRASPPAHAGPG